MAEERAKVSAKGWLTRAGRKLEKVIEEFENADDYSELEWRAEASAALADFDKRMNVFYEAQARYEATVEEEKLLEEIEKADIWKDSFSKVRAKVKAMLSDSSPSLKTSADMKLPKLDLPIFKSNYEQWPTFWETFEACVINTGMPEVNKFVYLRSLLRGEAAKSTEGLSLTTPHFKDACEMLKTVMEGQRNSDSCILRRC